MEGFDADELDDCDNEPDPQPTCSRVNTTRSPTFNCYYMAHAIKVTCDSGATSSLIKMSTAKHAGMNIQKTNHTASQADGKTKLEVVGEVHVTLARGKHRFDLEAIVVKDLDCDLLAGMSFMRTNGIALDIPNDTIIIGKNHTINYNYKEKPESPLNIRLLRASEKEILLPGDFLELQLDGGIDDMDVAFQARSDSPTPSWPPPGIASVVDGYIRIPNMSSDPIHIRKNHHVCQVTSLTDIDNCPNQISLDVPQATQKSDKASYSDIIIDPNNKLSPKERQTFDTLHSKYHAVFHHDIGCYNDASGKIRASINIGSVEPPSQKGRLPQYDRNNMQELQTKMDELESMGVLAKPDEVGVTVEHVSPSFLVKKPMGGTRLVTAFNNIAKYAKPPPSRVTKCDDVLRFLAQWNFIIKSDMTSQFFQLPMKKSSMKYLGVIAPYKGMRVYCRAAMGMPGSSEHLDELMFRVLGDLIHEGCVMKIADDLYVGGNSVESLQCNWEHVLVKFQDNNLRLSAKKTEVCPVTTTLLGWIWSNGSISISSHKINPLTNCQKPTTVKGLRSWIGAYKHLKACIPGSTSLLHPLDAVVAGKNSAEKIVWSEELASVFEKAQDALKSPKSITIPKPSDQLTITTDGAVHNGGVGSVLYIVRKGTTKLGGYFSAKLKNHQQRWLPCEIEGLAISAAVNHWGPYILESRNQTQVLSDSKPCVQAFKKLTRGQFSSSARVSSFISTLSRYNVQLEHLSGSSNIPADYLSRSPAICEEKKCQICKFVDDSSHSTVSHVSVNDVMQGKVPMPFTTLPAWRLTQRDCPALRRVYSHLTQGTRPTKKMTSIKDIKRYLQVVTVGNDGVLVVTKSIPFAGNQRLIVVPRHILPGLLNALHLQFEHPTKSQLQKVFHRHYFALDADLEIENITEHCSQCSSLATLPKEIVEYSTSDPVATIGVSFACDIMCRARQKIFIMRDTFSSYTVAKIIPDERRETLRNAIVETTADLKSKQGASIRVDCATGFQALVNDQSLERYSIVLDMGRTKNVNKNPVGEKAVQELEVELRKQHPSGSPLTTSDLAIAVAVLNNRIRERGLSAKEIVFQRDSLTGEQLNISDSLLSHQQHQQRIKNHEPSAKSKAPRGKPAVHARIYPGDLVFVKNEGSKHTARDRYIVTECDERFIVMHKLAGSQFRSKSYKLKYTEVYKVPCAQLPLLKPLETGYDSLDSSDSSDDDGGDYSSHHSSHSSSVEYEDAPQDAPTGAVASDDPGDSDIQQQTDDSDIPSASDSEDSLSDNSVENPLDHIAIQGDDTSQSSSDAESVDSGANLRRNRNPPAWMQSGEWDLK